MASLWFTLLVILYIISEIIAVPLRIAPQGNGYSGLDENLESGLSGQGIQNMRIRRAANQLPAGCENGDAFGLANVSYCHVTNAKYNAEMKLCLVELLHVPGMPDGTKGYNYIAYNHFLYKVYNSKNRLDIVKCPTATPKPAVNLSTSKKAPSATNSGTKPETSNENVKPVTTSSGASVSKTAQAKPTTVVKKTELDNQSSHPNTSGNTPLTATNQVVVSST